MKRIIILTIIIMLLITSVIVVVFANSVLSADKNKEVFYVGVTYGGNSTAEAKLLVDKVAGYTNLFVLQSGPLMEDTTAINEIGDYAESKGLHYAVYFDPYRRDANAVWLGNATARWGNMFAGVYYGDEYGGKMLEENKDLSPYFNQASVSGNGSAASSEWIKVMKSPGYGLDTNAGYFCSDGTIVVNKYEGDPPDPSIFTGENESTPVYINNRTSTTITYYPTSTIVIEENKTREIYYANFSSTTIEVSHNIFTAENGTDRISQLPTYQQLLDKNPLANCTAAAKFFNGYIGKPIQSFSQYWQLGNRSFPLFTSDYALYWWDYTAGYDMVIAQLGWNNSVNQEIGLVRGAATLQNKDWGTIITWKYMQPPYLPSGDEMYEQLHASYQAGARYAIIFNYAKDMNGTYGTLQEEHFQALERFWQQDVKSPFTHQGSIKAEAVLVLPKDFGWGMRNPTDNIWGIWCANSTSQQIWTVLQTKLSDYGARLDIVYEDPAYPVADKYTQVIYWNQTVT